MCVVGRGDVVVRDKREDADVKTEADEQTENATDRGRKWKRLEARSMVNE